jgi:ATP-dependent RNA helicase DDX31/DBP7
MERVALVKRERYFPAKEQKNFKYLLSRARTKETRLATSCMELNFATSTKSQPPEHKKKRERIEQGDNRPKKLHKGNARTLVTSEQLKSSGPNNSVKHKKAKTTLHVLPEIKKTVVRQLTAEQSAKFQRAGNSEAVFGERTFDELELHPSLLRTLKDSLHFPQPTLVQALALPAIMAKRDALIKSSTGSGKTLAFLLPVVHLLLSREVKVHRDHGTYAIMLAPTRELCLQIWEVLGSLLKFFPYIVAGHVMGGEKKKSEKARLRKGVSMLVATPGRLLDHLQHTEAFEVSRLEFLVLDEADRLLDLGFEKELKQILHLLDTKRPPQAMRRQHVLASATLDGDVGRLARSFLHEPERVDASQSTALGGKSVGPSAASADAPSRLSHHVIAVQNPANRLLALGALLRWAVLCGAQSGSWTTRSGKLEFVPRALPRGGEQGEVPGCKAIVFFSTCDSVAFHYKLLSHAFWPDLFTGEVSESSDSEPEAAELSASSNSSDAEPGVLDISSDDNDDDTSESAPTAAMRGRVRRSGLDSDGDDSDENDSEREAGDGEGRWLGGSDAVDARAAPSSQGQAQKARSGESKVEVTGGDLKTALLACPLFELRGDLPQATRTQTFAQFRSAANGILLCTDVAARGLDLPAVDWIVQYDPPDQVESYVHRSGRTARLGRDGHNVLFLLSAETAYLEQLHARGITPQDMKLATVLRTLDERVSVPDKHRRALERQKRLAPGAVLKKQFKRLVALDHSLGAMARQAFTSFVRAYAAYPKQLKHIFHPSKLHLGKVADAFALAEAPTVLGKRAKKWAPSQHSKHRAKLAVDTHNSDGAKELGGKEKTKTKQGKGRKGHGGNALSEFAAY